MRYWGRYVSLFILLEGISILIFSSIVGIWATLGTIVSCFCLGLLMFKLLGDTLAKTLTGMGQERPFTFAWYQSIGPVRYSIGALLLISPGIFSDILALIWLLPNAGQLISYYKKRQTEARRKDGGSQNVFEGEFRELKKTPK